MSKQLEHIDSELAEWISRQKVFFVATAPLSPNGHLNVSPKGGEALRILAPMRAVYQDYTGSGAETVAHLRENGRMVIMFCAFEGPPKIVRLHGTGTVITPEDAKFSEMAALFPSNPGTRAFIEIAVKLVSSSCGYSVPFFEFRGHRDTLDRWADAKGSENLRLYRATKNVKSIDGLPAFEQTGGKP